MAVPRIYFKYSWIYDEHWREVYTDDKNYPSYKKTKENLLKVEKEWRKSENDILKELSKISGLKWKKKGITCYVVGRCVSFSDPLTIMCHKKYPVNYAVDVLTHELVHQLFIQEGNEESATKAWAYFHKKYKTEDFNTIIHIPLHAMHHHIFMKFFGEKRLQREIDFMNDLPDYKKSWDIVLEEGAENIIERFRERVA